MEKHVITGKYVNDQYDKIKHPSGLDIFVYPKKGSGTYAIFGTKYGSVDNCFQRSDESAPESVPDGIAHFLEHKLFESEDGNAFERYAKTGASANAFTSFETTCYLFSCTEQVYESLEILLDFVQSPYFTEETVQKEQGIIGQEIKMYDDDPQWKVAFNHLKALYHNHSIKDDIAGTVESISHITAKHLYRCYETFYNLNNMALCVVGNVTTEEVLAVCDRMLKPAEPVRVTRVIPAEPDTVVTHYIEERLSVAVPLFQFGYKEKVSEENRSDKDIAAVEVLLEIIASSASPLFRRLLDEGLVNESSFSHEYFEGSGFACVFFGGESNDPKATAKLIAEEITRLQKEGISQETFEHSKRAVYGSVIQALDSNSVIANTILTRSFKDGELFGYIDACAGLVLSDVEEKLKTVFNGACAALSVVLPLE